MSTRIIRIWPLLEHMTQQEIRNSLKDIDINRIHIGKGEAYVQLQNEDSIEVLEFTFPGNKIDQLDGANFEKVEASFKWDSLSSDSSSIQDLKQQREHFEKTQEYITNLTQPAPQNLITISNCNPKVVANITENQIKTQIFAAFSTINRILKKGSKVVIQLQMSETQLLQAKFLNLKIPALGEGAFIDLDAQNEKDFSTQWIQQQKFSQGKKLQQQVKHVLHEQIIPKLNKLTSMETNFILSQNNQSQNTESNFTNITQQSSQYVHTKNQLPEEEIGFIMGDQWKKANKQQQKKIQQQRQRKLFQQQTRRRQQQQEKKIQAQKIQRQRQQKQRKEKQRIRQQKQQRQRQQEQRLEEQRIRRQKQRLQEQRIRRQKQQRQRQQKQRLQAEERERERHIIEENKKLQRLKELKLSQERQREEIQRRQGEAKQKQIQERLKKQNQQLEKERIRIQKQKQQQQRLEKERIEKENAARKFFEERRKQIQQAQRQEKQRNKGQFILPQVINNMKENIQKGKIDNFSNLDKTQAQTPLAFWSIVLVTLLALLLI